MIARYQRLQGKEILLLVGIDEHSINVARKAEELGLKPKEYCDQMADIYQSFFKDLNINYGRLIRTSDIDHHQVVSQLILRLAEKGYIYPGKYEGWYCSSCEAFYRERDLVDGHCPVHKFLEPEWIVEYNYYFRLSSFEEEIYKYITDNPQWIKPVSRRNEILKRLEEGLEDISISRSGTDWGIDVPSKIRGYINDQYGELDLEDFNSEFENQKVYVWFDALLNYVTGAGYNKDSFSQTWPADLELIGKDIIWFHAVIQSAVLLALDISLPKQIYAHGFLTLEGEKISSSQGNVLYPKDIIDEFGLDPLRYYLFRRISFGQDGNFSRRDFIEVYNTSLANVLGNLVYRSFKMVEKYFGGVIPEPEQSRDVDQSLLDNLNTTIKEVENQLDDLELSQALLTVENFLRKTNGYIDQTAPWKIEDRSRLATVIYHLLNAIYNGVILLKPFIPESSDKILSKFGNDNIKSWPDDGATYLKSGCEINSGEPLFPRIENNK